MKSVNLTLLSLTLLAASPAFAQPHPHQAAAPLPPDVAQPIHLYKVGLGIFSRKITTSNPEAQAFFDQGFQLMYSFARREAIRSFREAWQRDAGCAMCYWGEAWAWGPNLNESMAPEQSRFAYAAIQKALALKSTASPVEQAFIDAMAVRYVEFFDASPRIDRDRAYAGAMSQVYEKYPNDLDAGTLYADALFLLEPRPGPAPGRRPRLSNLDAPNTRRIHEVLEALLAQDPRHPGACHWYVHATEATPKVGQAQACAEYLGKSIPGASHINHMPSHTFNEVGRWGDSVRANIEAWHSDLKAVAGEGIAIYPTHNLHMLVYAASMDGQGALAMQAGKDYAKLTGNTGYQALTMIRFGRFDEVPEVTKPPRGDIAGAMWEFAQGYASLRAGRESPTRESLMRLQSAAGTSQETFSSARHPARAPSRPARRHSRRRNRTHRRRHGGGTCRVRTRGGVGRCARRRRTRADSVSGAALAGRSAARNRQSRGRRARVPRGSEGASTQRVGAARVAESTGRPGQVDRRCRRRSRAQLEQVGYVDSRVAVLNVNLANPVESRCPCVGSTSV